LRSWESIPSPCYFILTKSQHATQGEERLREENRLNIIDVFVDEGIGKGANRNDSKKAWFS
jgi:hypothetical protein